jgi:hypothetical protein
MGSTGEWEWALRGWENEKDITQNMGMRNAEEGTRMAEQEWWHNTEWHTTLAALISSRDKS